MNDKNNRFLKGETKGRTGKYDAKMEEVMECYADGQTCINV